MSFIKLYPLGPTELTWEEECFPNLFSKGEYLDNIDEYFEDFLKNQKNNGNSSKNNGMKEDSSKD